MASLPVRSARLEANPVSPRRQHRIPGDTRNPPARRVDKVPLLFDTAKQKNLSKSVTEFFSKLRPSKRPERGNTIRPPPDSYEERQSAEPRSPKPTASCRAERSSSLGRYGPDTIPASRWNTPVTPPRRAQSVGARGRGRRPMTTQPPLQTNTNRHHNPIPISTPNKERFQIPPPPYPLTSPPTTQTHPNPNPNPNPTLSRPQAQTPIPIPTPTPTLATTLTPSTRDLFLAKRALRRQRHTLISSGDFLGVTGANPYTGEPDLITPPTSSDDAVVTSSSSPTTATATGTGTGAGMGADMVGGGGGGAERELLLLRLGRGTERERERERKRERERDRDREERVGRQMLREAERLSRAEQRKEAMRVLLRQGGGVKWRPGPGGWSSVAEPNLSPIMQSPQGSGKSSVQGEGAGVLPQEQQQQQSFLGMAAVARGVNGCHRRRCGNLKGEARVVLTGWKRSGAMILEMAGDMGKGLCLLRTVMLRFCLPPLVCCREGPRSLLHDINHTMEYQPEWELGNLRVTPIDLHRLADDCRGRRIPTSRVLELDDLRAAESWGSRQLCNLDSLRDPTDMIPKACSMGVSHGLGQAFQSVCTRTITTTGFGHSRPRRRAVAHLFDGTLGGSHEAPRSRRVLMPRALSQSTSPPLSTGMSENVYSNRLASPGQMQLSVWFNPNSPGPRTATSTLDQKKVGIDPLKGSPIPHPLRKPGADSDTTSPSTGQGRTAPGPEKYSAKPNPIAAETENRPAQREQPDWEMRKTMRSPSGNGSPQDETDTHRSSHTSTRTSTSPTSPTTPAQPPSPGTARAPWLNQAAAETIARGAARTAFAHHQGGSGWAQQTRVPVSAPDPGPQPPHRARARVQAAGTRAKPAAKPGAGAETGSGQGSGQGKGTGKGKSEGRGDNEKNGKEMGKDKDKEKEKDKEKDKEKGKGKANTADPNKIEAKRWARSAMLMSVKVVGAYWQVVSPVFDGDSQLRKRIDKAQATRGDAVVCVLAVVFLFLAVSGGVWAIRGIVWFVKLLGKLGEVLGVVAGLHD